jgi:hypothetical protein
MAPPTKAPTTAELLSDPVVRQAMDQAWIDSQPGDPNHRHEEGAWIYLNLKTGAITTRRCPAGGTARLSFANPPVLPDHVIVGTLHTHPNPSAEGWEPGPSSQDDRGAHYSGVPWLIRSDQGDFSTGPDSRRGGLGGGPGFPP